MEFNKKEYIEKAEEQLKVLRTKFDELKVKAGGMKEKAKDEYDKCFEIFHAKLDECHNKITQLKETHEETWVELKKSTDNARQELHDMWLAVKQAYVDKIEPQLKDCGEKIEELKGKAVHVQAEARAKHEQHVEEALKKLEHARVKLNELKNSSGEAWHELKVGVDKAWDDFRQAFENAAAKFKHDDTE